MDSISTRISLDRSIFREKERQFLASGSLLASTICYPSGVAGLRMSNACGELLVLPFQGQQIWSACFNGRELTMRSMFSEPRATRIFEQNYGAFLIHCGASAMGDPSAEDTHPLHGELPNAPYQEAELRLGEDEKGRYLAITGKYQHTIAFSCNYLAEPCLKLYEESSLLTVSMAITNLKRSEMELMYLAHINFRPVNQARLVYSAIPSAEHVRVRPYAPGLAVPDGYQQFIEDLAIHPEKHHRMGAEMKYDPEAVFFIDYLSDTEGWAHSMQVLPDGSADYVRFKPAQLKKGVRWITRTADQDALGLALPATAESEGYLKEKSKGNILNLGAGEKFVAEFEAGAINAVRAGQVEKEIGKILSSAV